MRLLSLLHCSECQKDLHASKFSKNKKTKTGYQNVCKKCFSGFWHSWNARNRERKAETNRLWKERNVPRINFNTRRRKATLREEFIVAYGSECSCCKEDISEFLTLEHMNRDGAWHRGMCGSGWGTYMDLKKRGWPKDGFTLLCMNCNWGTRNGNICPHKLKKGSAK